MYREAKLNKVWMPPMTMLIGPFVVVQRQASCVGLFAGWFDQGLQGKNCWHHYQGSHHEK